MIGNGHSRMPPLGGALNQSRGGRHRVQVAHLGMQMQLDTLFIAVILALGNIVFHQRIDHQRGLVGKCIVAAIALDHHAVALLQALDDIGHIGALLVGNGQRLLGIILLGLWTIAQEHFALDGIGIVRYVKGHQQAITAADFLFLVIQPAPGDDHLARIAGQILDGNGLFGDGTATDQAALFLLGGFAALAQGFLVLARQLAPLLGNGFLGAAFALHAGGGFLPHAHHAAAYLDLRAENIINRLVDLIRQPALLEVAHSKVVGQFQHHAAILGHIAHIILPGGQRGMIAQQDIVDHMRIAIGIL